MSEISWLPAVVTTLPPSATWALQGQVAVEQAADADQHDRRVGEEAADAGPAALLGAELQQGRRVGGPWSVPRAR